MYVRETENGPVLVVRPGRLHLASRGFQGLGQAPSTSGPADGPVGLATKVFRCVSPASQIDVGRAARLNRYYAKKTGWGSRRHDISRLLGLRPDADESAFAVAVAYWQCVRDLVVDGIVGRNTWGAMQRALAGSAPAPPPRPAPASGPPDAGTGREPPAPPARAGDILTRVTGEWAWRGGGVAKGEEDRCPPQKEIPCPRIRLLRMTAVGGVPFKYVADSSKPRIRRIAIDPATGLFKVVSRQSPRVQDLVPQAAEALLKFLDNMRRFGMPVGGILTMGSLVCRCIGGTERLSNHSFGDAIDIAGVEWAPGSPSSLPDTLIHNHAVALWYWARDGKPVVRKGPVVDEQTRLVRRMNACLRLSFPTVIDYYDKRHRNHFHCDLRGTGEGRFEPGRRHYRTAYSTWNFVQEALSVVFNRGFKQHVGLDDPTRKGLMEFSGRGPEIFKNHERLDSVLDDLFLRVARGP